MSDQKQRGGRPTECSGSCCGFRQRISTEAVGLRVPWGRAIVNGELTDSWCHPLNPSLRVLLPDWSLKVPISILLVKEGNGIRKREKRVRRIFKTNWSGFTQQTELQKYFSQDE